MGQVWGTTGRRGSRYRGRNGGAGPSTMEEATRRNYAGDAGTDVPEPGRMGHLRTSTHEHSTSTGTSAALPHASAAPRDADEQMAHAQADMDAALFKVTGGERVWYFIPRSLATQSRADGGLGYGPCWKGGVTSQRSQRVANRRKNAKQQRQTI